MLTGGSPVKGRWNRPGAVGGGDEQAGHKFGRQVGGVNRSKEMDADELVDKAGSEAEGAAGRQG